VGSLSGGERSRAALARLSATSANFLVLDEPTNHLDLWACDALEKALLAFDGTVLLVSHDRYFLNRVVDHLLVVEPQRFRTIQGNYDTYLYQSANRQPAETTRTNGDARKSGDAKAAEEKPAEKAGRPKRKFPYRKVADLEAEIFARETRIEELNAELLAPETLRDGRRVKAVQTEVAAEQQALATLYEHWEEASQLNSG
jgi:ATP-binding cassette subfamily F protein 3